MYNSSLAIAARTGSLVFEGFYPVKDSQPLWKEY